MMLCAAATSSPARAGAARPIRSATSRIRARMKMLRWYTAAYAPPRRMVSAGKSNHLAKNQRCAGNHQNEAKPAHVSRITGFRQRADGDAGFHPETAPEDRRLPDIDCANHNEYDAVDNRSHGFSPGVLKKL